MPTTATLLLPYPQESSPADVPVDIKALADRLEAVRGAANGLASLDATTKIPAAQLPSGVFVPYSVVGQPNGVASLDGGGKVPLAQLPAIGPSYGTTFPASPADGQEHILVDSVSNPSWIWRFRYNAGSSSSYKWEFIGGAPLIVATNVTSLPAHAGDYFVEGSGWVNTDGGSTTGGNTSIGLSVGGTTIDTLSQNSPPAGGGSISNSSSGHYGTGLRGRINGAAASAGILHGFGSNPHTTITPVRIS